MAADPSAALDGLRSVRKSCDGGLPVRPEHRVVDIPPPEGHARGPSGAGHPSRRGRRLLMRHEA